METEPEGTAQKYIFLVDNQEIALNIIISGYQSLYLVQEEEDGYYSIDGFVDEMRSMQFQGSCQSSYHYVAACTVKWMNDRILEFCKDAGLDGKSGWQLFKEKEYLGNFDNKQELGKVLEQFILRFEREPKNDPELSRFHKFDSKGKVTGVRDMEIVDYIVENVSFFVRGEIPYYYEHGVFIEDARGVKLKYRIQKLIYRNSYELNKQPAHWINFKNAYYDVLTDELVEHDPKYLTINQIPFPYYPEDREKVLGGGENIRKYLDSSIPDKVEQQMFWEYFGYCMTTDTQFQKFLMLKGNGGTGKSVAVALIQHVIGNENTSSISLQDLNKRFYATGMYGKLLNACADIPCKAMDTTDVLKKAVGEDTLLYEKKGKDAVFYKAYAKLLFSTNEMPQNLEDKSDAFYRRLLVLDMNQMIPREEKDIRLKEKIKAEADYAIHMAVTALKDVYDRGELIESEHSKECVWELRRLSDSVCAFLEEKLVKEKGKRLKRSDVFRMYEEYCEDNGRQGHAKSGFFKNMEGKGFQARKYNGDYCYQDIAVREEDFQPLEAGDRTPFEEHSEQLKLNI